ncbi:MAG: DUF177 domain-containing protein [Anaerolineales bacterium]|nr:DUF177 domain-containing protein [Anaerolineales bacterium]MCX7609862.1 DUF177 domain-containing protein [Anaerolineales bacterium]MDW8226823.1 DUF177 domain-containing protein [Anaerolineales bacterium]
MTDPRHPLRLNVGFLVSAAVGFSRVFSFAYESIRLGDDLVVADFVGSATFSRTQQGLLVQGEFLARLEVECVRCLEPFLLQVNPTFTDLYAFDRRSLSESNLLVPEDGQIDLAPLLREYALLEVPIMPICRPDCQGLCPVCGENLNLHNCGHRLSQDDSPFSILKDLLP